MNPYEFYFEGERRPFWLWKDRWSKTAFLVVLIDEPKSGGPYYGNPSVWLVLAEKDEVKGFRLVPGETVLRGAGQYGTYNWSFRLVEPSDFLEPPTALPSWARELLK